MRIKQGRFSLLFHLLGLLRQLDSSSESRQTKDLMDWTVQNSLLRTASNPRASAD